VQCRASAVAAIGRNTARRLRLGRTAQRIGIGTATIVRPGRIPFFVKLTPRVRRALARKKVRRFSVTLLIAVTDQSGDQLKRSTKRITLR
jgi:hypothetical protein